ncbi:sensor histidine kinase [Virgisporangium aurantiacum]|uniref:histidine kinase n=1 Tax=Virgisporangium aurantiacum TaxID=175570 RepID=A0A8J3ZEL6_9ACTN|nr:histidine kinase [Virgisporangium aurantiacum]GIJ60230.1 hypothetical protein Vau01_077460 [Virgisporangium aurantiacum]
MTRILDRLGRPLTARWAVALDLSLAAAFLVAMVAIRVAEGGDRLALAVVLSVVIAGSLVPRRRYPLGSYVVGSSGLVVESLAVSPGQLTPYANLIGLYALGFHASRGRALVGPVILVPGVLAYFAHENGSSVASAVGVVVVWLLAWAAGYAVARRREQMEAYRRLVRREAVINERVRIARELHDVIGHTVNTMLVQAGAGRVVLDTDPDRARELLVSVERTGRNALAELDRVLGVLRSDDEPEPGLDDLDTVVRPLVDAGMAVRVELDASLGGTSGTDSAARGLPRGLELSAHRIVQEGLTNALKHGRARSATVRIRLDAMSTLVVEVRDDGRGPGAGYRPGRGLLGIAERVSVLGGTVEHGPAPGRGFVLRALLPVHKDFAEPRP